MNEAEQARDAEWLDDGARQTRAYHDSLVRAGFSEEQALDLLKTVLFAYTGGRFEVRSSIRDALRFRRRHRI